MSYFKFVASEEREVEIEKMYEQLDLSNEKYTAGIGAGTEGGAVSHEMVCGPAKKTAESLKAGELLYEALLIWEKDRADQDTFEALKKSDVNVAPPPRDPLIIKMNCADRDPEQFVLEVILQIRPSHLTDALVALPFSQVVNLITIISCLSAKVQLYFKFRMSSLLLYALESH
jgi:U3 small nucleolar RNA-associated protein 12